MLTKKYYEMIASNLLDARASVTSRDEIMTAERLTAVETVAYLLASDFERDNPKFDRARFFRACGVQS
jgi:hypothetical protein